MPIRIICDKPGCPTSPVELPGSFEFDGSDLVPEGWTQDIVGTTHVLVCPDCGTAMKLMRERYLKDGEESVKRWFDRQGSA